MLGGFVYMCVFLTVCKDAIKDKVVSALSVGCGLVSAGRAGFLS